MAAWLTLRESSIRMIKCAIVLAVLFSVSACATAQLHSDAQLNSAGSACGLRLGELIQDESEKRLLLVVRDDSSSEQRSCVTRWARANHLKTVFVHMDFPQS